ncbi:MAG: hypothetical protein RBS57_19730 [Desulforhabdus sp.]|jgi:hypothetical protein|nr:hypothetical protein [Desulforhabdus sp.]
MKLSRFSQYKKFQKVNRPLDPPRKIEWGRVAKINDRVETAHGFGTVIEISDDRYLIALDGQLGRVWERLMSLKFVSSK